MSNAYNTSSEVGGLEIAYTCTSSEIREARAALSGVRSPLTHRPGTNAALGWILWLGCCGLLYWLIPEQINTFASNHMEALGVAAFFMLAVLAAWIWIRRMIYRGVRLEDGVTVRLTERGWFEHRKGLIIERPWDSFTEIIETKNLYVLRCHDSNQGMLLPKRLVGPVEKHQALLSLLNRKIAGLARESKATT